MSLVEEGIRATGHFSSQKKEACLVLRETQASARQRAGEKGMLAVANGTCPRGDWAGKTRE